MSRAFIELNSTSTFTEYKPDCPSLLLAIDLVEPRMKRKSRRRRKERMASKKFLLVRLLVSGLGLEPRWLLNRFQIIFVVLSIM